VATINKETLRRIIEDASTEIEDELTTLTKERDKWMGVSQKFGELLHKAHERANQWREKAVAADKRADDLEKALAKSRQDEAIQHGFVVEAYNKIRMLQERIAKERREREAETDTQPASRRQT
jgi:hypothetical protein